MFTSFKLDNYFTKNYVFYNLPSEQINDLPELNKILLKLKNFLYEHEYSSAIAGQGQIYTYTRRFYNGDYCEITWDIDIIKSIIKDENLPVVKAKVESLIPIISKEIDPAYLKTAIKNNDPIIIANLDMFSDDVILDGNHRAMSRFKNNIEWINAYMLYPKDYYFAMIDDTSRAIFHVASIMKLIKLFLMGFASKQDLTNCLNELDNFFEFSVEKQLLNMIFNK